MASSSLASTINSSRLHPKCFSKLPSLPLLASTYSVKPFPAKLKAFVLRRRLHSNTTVRVQTLDFQGSFYEGGFGSDDEPPLTTGLGMTAVEEKEPPQCPPGLRQYETMAVLRPDMSEDERLGLTQKYEEVMSLGFCLNA
uniref:Uncharacterized protein MANES_11G077900 n=1 Tax=Rhizophora mucronata TaxID=61149 RepID=A0A2P2IQB2_RHIMU